MSDLREALLAEAAAAEAEAELAEARAAAARAQLGAAELKKKSAGADAAVDPPASGRAPVARRLWIAVTLCIVVACVALGFLGYMVHYDTRAKSTAHRDSEFVDAARRGVEALLSIDYTRAEDDVQRVLGTTTGSFREEFSDNAADFITAATESKSVSTAEVTGAALENRTDDAATVLVAANSKVTNANGAQQEPRAWRMVVTVVPDGDQLKVSKVEFLS